MARPRDVDPVVLSALRARKITLWVGGGSLLALGLAILWLCRLPLHPLAGQASTGRVERLYSWGATVTNATQALWAEQANRALKKQLTAMTSVIQFRFAPSDPVGNVTVTTTAEPKPGLWDTSEIMMNRVLTETTAPSGGGAAAGDTFCTLMWVPAFSDILDLSFDVLPDNPAGPPPYVWSGRPLDAAGPITATYRYPLQPIRNHGWEIVHAVYQEGGKWYSLDPQMLEKNLGSGAGGAAPAPPSAVVAASQTAEKEYIQYTQYLSGEATMTPDLCQAFSDALAAGYLFVAVRAPVVASENSPGGVRSSLLGDRPPLYSGLELGNTWNGQAGFLARLTPAPEYVNTLETAYPSPPGLAWMALQALPSPDRIDCSLFPLASGWHVMWNLLLEKEPADGHVLNSFFCYRGENPVVMAALGQAAAASGQALRTAAAADGPCLTCLGPTNVSLHPYGSVFDVEWSWFELNVQPDGRRIAFPHSVVGLPGVADLRYAYLQAPPGPLSWSFFGDAGGNYDLSKPISTLSADGTIWLVSDPVAGDTVPGDYSLRVTVAPQAGGATASTVDSVWVYPLYGDVNEDKATNAQDVVLLADYLAEKIRLSALGKLAADYNQDGLINARDLVSLGRAVVSY